MLFNNLIFLQAFEIKSRFIVDYLLDIKES